MFQPKPCVAIKLLSILVMPLAAGSPGLDPRRWASAGGNWAGAFAVQPGVAESWWCVGGGVVAGGRCVCVCVCVCVSGLCVLVCSCLYVCVWCMSAISPSFLSLSPFLLILNM